MSKSYREIERKLLLPPGPFHPQTRRLEQIYEGIISPTCILRCRTQDAYWRSPNLQSIRLRDSCGYFLDERDHRRRELTVKRADKGDNVDRYEVNCNVTSIANARELVTAIVGAAPVLEIEKQEVVLWGSGGLVVSLYQVSGPGERLYLEVEAPEVEMVDKALEALKPSFPGSVPEPRSLFEIYSEQ